MTDFYSVLQRAVASLPDANGPQRRAVYDKARKALLKQLQSFDPPLPSSDVTSQRLALEDAIRKLEADIVRSARTKRAVASALPAGGAPRSGDATAPPREAPPANDRPAAGEEAPEPRGPAGGAIRDAGPGPGRPGTRRPEAAEAPRAADRGDLPPRDHDARADIPLDDDLDAALAPDEMGEADVAPPDVEGYRDDPPAPQGHDEAGPYDDDAPFPDEDLTPGDDRPGRVAPQRERPRKSRRMGIFSRGDEAAEAEEAGEQPRRPGRSGGKGRRGRERDGARDGRVRVGGAPPPPQDDVDATAYAEADDRFDDRRDDADEAPRGGRGGDALVPVGPRRNALGEVDEPEADYSGVVPGEFADERYGGRQPSNHNRRVAKILLTVGVLVVLAGAGVAAYLQRDAIMTFVAGLTGGADGRSDPVAVGEQDAGASKDDARLGDPPESDDEEVRRVQTTRIVPGAENDGTQETAPPDAQTPTETPVPGGQPETAPPAAGAEPAPENDQRTAAEADADAVRDAAPSAPAVETTGGVEQAVLYEEAAQIGERGAAVPGTVTWSFADKSVGGGQPEPVIEAITEIPERGIVATILIRENRDGALPASHLIEVSFELQEAFPGEGIANVPGLILKDSEQARGNALRGAAARVSANLFWIALSDAAAERELNGELLRDRGWIDLPILYENGRRAILTLQKGSTGDRVIEEAFAAWNAG